jgi:cysteine-rich repeat protein
MNFVKTIVKNKARWFGMSALLALAGCGEARQDQAEKGLGKQHQALGMPGGFVVVSGDDADDCGHGEGAALGSLYRNLFLKGLSESKTSGSGILAIGSNGSCGRAAFDSWVPAGTPVTHAVDIAGVDFASFKLVYIASVETHTLGGMTLGQLGLLNTRAADIKKFVNEQGGSLIALTEADTAGGWGWLPVPLTTEDISYSDAEPTPELLVISPTTTDTVLDHCCFHNVFSGPAGFSGLSVLATKKEAGPFAGMPSLLGGSGTILTAEVCDDGIDNDGDGTVDNADVDCQRCGDGDLDPLEACDDGNLIDGDGCSSTCSVENQPPTALCQSVTVSADAVCGAVTSIDAGSSDPDGDAFGCVQDPPAPYALGATLVTLTCTDSHGETAACSASVIVVDDTAPSISCPADQTAECVNGSANVTFADPTTSDNCGPVTSSCAPPSGSAFGLGANAVTCTAADPAGNSAACNFGVTIQDTTAPTVSVAGFHELWPPNHKYPKGDYATATLADCGITIVDQCQGPISLGAANATITCVTSDELENEKGDGNTSNDAVILSGSSVKLRAERSGKGDGRVYNIHFRVTDAAGNTSNAVCPVTVPHDQSGAPAVDSGVKYTVGTCG